MRVHGHTRTLCTHTHVHCRSLPPKSGQTQPVEVLLLPDHVSLVLMTRRCPRCHPPRLLWALQAPHAPVHHPSRFLSWRLPLTRKDCQVHDHLTSECQQQPRGHQTLEDTERSARAGFVLSPLGSNSDIQGWEVEADGLRLVLSQGLYRGL